MKRITATISAMILIGGLTIIRPNGDMEIWSHNRAGNRDIVIGIGTRDNYLGTVETDRRGNTNVYEIINTEYERNHRTTPVMDDDDSDVDEDE